MTISTEWHRKPLLGEDMKRILIITLVFFTCLLGVYGLYYAIGEQTPYIGNVTFYVNNGFDDPNFDPLESYSPVTALVLFIAFPGSVLLCYYVITRFWWDEDERI